MAGLALDDFDLRLLRLLQEDARLSHVALSERVHLSPSQCARRLQRLEQAGVVEGYSVRLDDRLAGLGVMALVNVTLERHGESPATTLHATLEALPEVVECLLITGDADYQLRVSARPRELLRLHHQKARAHPGHHGHPLEHRFGEDKAVPRPAAAGPALTSPGRGWTDRQGGA